MTTLKDHELRDLQQFMTQSPLLSPYVQKFAAENLTREIIIKADDTLLKMISDQFQMKLGEYASLRLLIANHIPTSPLSSKRKKVIVKQPDLTSSQASSQISDSATNNQPLSEGNSQPQIVSIADTAPREESKEVMVQALDDKEELNEVDKREAYKDNTIEKFTIGK